MVGWEDHEDVFPKEKEYSIVVLDPWKAPSDDDFVRKIEEIDSLEEGPERTGKKGSMRGETVFVLDQDGNTVSLPEELENSTQSENNKK